MLQQISFACQLLKAEEQLLQNPGGVKHMALPKMPAGGDIVGMSSMQPGDTQAWGKQGSRAEGGKGKAGKEYLLGWSISRHRCGRFLGPEKCIYRRCRIFFFFLPPFFVPRGQSQQYLLHGQDTSPAPSMSPRPQLTHQPSQPPSFFTSPATNLLARGKKWVIGFK